MWVAVHKCMEAMLRISLYTSLYLKLAKVSFLLSPVFFLQQNQIPLNISLGVVLMDHMADLCLVF
jgi:hypothetical protein